MSMTAEMATDRDALGEQTRERLRIALTCDPDERDRIHEQVVNSHLWLADSLARRFRRPSEDIEDLQQVARTGLVQAVRRYDPEHGPFTAFAVPTITGVLKRHFRDHGWLVRPPRRTQELSAQMRQQWPELTQRLRTAPSDQELADSLSDSLEAVGARGSLDEGHPDDISQCENRLMLARVWRQLTAEERKLLVLRF